jgi:hypothetical protein
MIKQLTLRNFRKFGELTLGGDESPLRPITIITGDNNSGKTSILEALFLSAAWVSPNRVEALNTFRGALLSTADARTRYGWLARGQNLTDPVEIQTTGETGVEDHSTIRFHDVSQSAISAVENGDPSGEEASTTFAPVPVVTMTHATDGRVISQGQFLTTGSRLIETTPKVTPPVSVYLPTAFRRTSDDVVEFSRLMQARRDGELIASLRERFALERLVIGSDGGRPVLLADTGCGPLQPIHLLGDGFRRILSLSLAISQSAGQRVMIDEFETGIHHSNLVSTWAHIARLARRENVQLFVTTHSWECLTAAHEALRDEFADDVSYFRLETDSDGDFAMDFTFESLADALERRMEIR